jgi:hypothetical protein
MSRIEPYGVGMAGDSLLRGIREYRSLADVRSAAAGRLDRGGQSCLFDRIDWLESLHICCMAGQMPRILHASDGDSAAWLFLATGNGRSASAIANWYSFAFRPIFSGSPDEATKARLLAMIARALLKDRAQIDLYPVRADDGSAAMLLGAFRSAGWFAVARPMGHNHHLDLNGRDFATWWSARPRTLQNIVRRKGKGSGLEFEIHDRLSDARWQDYVTIYDHSWKAGEPDYAFLRALAERESDAGTLRLGFARHEGRAVATQLWTVENGVALIHKLAHLRDADTGSPGTLLSHAMFRAAIDGDGVESIDYGTGDNAYKAQWMEGRRALLRVDCFNPRFASAWLPAARTALSWLAG